MAQGAHRELFVDERGKESAGCHPSPFTGTLQNPLNLSARICQSDTVRV